MKYFLVHLYLAGPYYKYRTYYDMLHNEHARSIPTWRPLLKQLKIVPFIAAGFLLVSHFFSIEVSTALCWCRMLYVVWKIAMSKLLFVVQYGLQDYVCQ